MWRHAEFIWAKTAPGLREALATDAPLVVCVERAVTADEICNMLAAITAADTVVAGPRLAPRAVCWRHDVLAAALAEPVSFAVTPRLVRRAARMGCRIAALDAHSPLPAILPDRWTDRSAARRMPAPSWNTHVA